MNKPVAYIDHISGKPKLIDAYVVQTDYDIPLYTHPVKELTDEEIIKTMVQFDVYSNDDQCLIEAGRAILRKAQEK